MQKLIAKESRTGAFILDLYIFIAIIICLHLLMFFKDKLNIYEFQILHILALSLIFLKLRLTNIGFTQRA